MKITRDGDARILSLIAAMTPSGVIGLDNTLPWRMPEDMKLFKRITMGNILIMGRKTYESIGKPLPGRKSFVISSSAMLKAGGNIISPGQAAETESAIDKYSGSGPFFFSSLEDALSAAQKTEGSPFVIGGASVYRQALPFADRLYLSMIKKEYEGNVFFPPFDRKDWILSEETDYGDFVLNVLKRV